MKHSARKLLSLFLVMALFLSVLPAPTMAAEGDPNPPAPNEGSEGGQVQHVFDYEHFVLVQAPTKAAAGLIRVPCKNCDQAKEITLPELISPMLVPCNVSASDDCQMETAVPLQAPHAYQVAEDGTVTARMKVAEEAPSILLQHFSDEYGPHKFADSGIPEVTMKTGPDGWVLQKLNCKVVSSQPTPPPVGPSPRPEAPQTIDLINCECMPADTTVSTNIFQNDPRGFLQATRWELNGTLIPHGTPLVPNTEYTLVINITPRNSYRFAPNMRIFYGSQEIIPDGPITDEVIFRIPFKLADPGTPETITSVEIPELPASVTVAELEPSMNAPYSISLVWRDGDQLLAPGTHLTAGQAYTVEIILKAKPNFRFALPKDMLVRINSIDVEINSIQNANDGLQFICTVTYTVPEVPPDNISILREVFLNLLLPSHGRKPSQCAVPSTEQYTVDSQWSRDGVVMTDEDTFVQGMAYCLCMTITPKSGFRFNQTVTVHMNPGDAKNIMTPERDGTLTVNLCMKALGGIPTPVIQNVRVCPPIPQAGIPALALPNHAKMYRMDTAWRQGEKLLEPGELFQPDTVYNLELTLTPESGCRFSNPVTVEGMDDEPFTASPEADGRLILRREFPRTGAPEPIDKVDGDLIGIPDVAAPSFPVPKGCHYTVSAEWSAFGLPVEPSTPLERGIEYEIDLLYTPEKGYQFAPSVKIMLGDSCVTSLDSEENGQALHLHSSRFIHPKDDLIQLVGVADPLGSFPDVPQREFPNPVYATQLTFEKDGQPVELTEQPAPGNYTAVFTFTPEDGYRFAPTVSARCGNRVQEALTPVDGKVVLRVPVPYQGQAIAQILREGQPVNYATFDEAFADAKDGEEILLLDSCSTDAGINLNKNITVSAAPGKKPTLTFTTYGMALWGKSLTFNGVALVMKGVGSTPYTAEWNWMAICGQAGSRLTLNGSSLLMDGTGLKASAIYADSGMQLNLNSSTLTIQNFSDNALAWNGGSFDYHVNLTDSTFTSSHNRSGFVGNFTVKALRSTVNVLDSTGNGSNGAKFEFVDSKVNFSRNKSHGLSASTLTVNNSQVTADGNGANGVHVTGTLTVSNQSVMTITGNGCSISSKWTQPGALLLAGDASFSGSTLTVTGNSGSGIHQVNPKTLTFDDACRLTITGNTAKKLGFGGGIAAVGTVKLPASAVICNNHGSTVGDDIAMSGESASLTFPAVASGYKLDGTEGTNDCLLPIDGWYADGPAPIPMQPMRMEFPRWNPHSLEDFFVHLIAPGTIQGNLCLKAAHGVNTIEETKLHSLSFRKVDADSGKALKGAEFTLYANRDLTTKLEAFTSDAKGEFTVKQPAGTYYLKETKAPDGYELNSQVYVLNIRSQVVDTEAVLDESTTPCEVKLRSIVSTEGFVDNMEPQQDGFHLIQNERINRREIEISKIWKGKDPKRPDSVVVALLANGREAERFTLCERNDWSASILVPARDSQGRDVTYTVKEITNLANYTVTYDGFDVINTYQAPSGKPGTSPKTGDEADLVLWTGLMLLSASLAAAMAFELRKKSRR